MAAASFGALAAPAGFALADQSALDVISQWQNDGYQVNIDRVGSGPLSQCVVTSVRNPNTITQLQRITRGHGDNEETVLVPVVVSRTVNLSLYCA